MPETTSHALLLKVLRAKGQQMLGTKYAQYDRYFDSWVLGRMRRTIRFKGGSVLRKGEIVLVNPLTFESPMGYDEQTRTFFDVTTRSVFDHTTGWCCGTEAVDVELLG